MSNYSAFTTAYNGRSNRLINEAFIKANNEEMHTSSAQWDTGATKTCISQAVIDRLGLIPVGQTMVKTPSGEQCSFLLNDHVVWILFSPVCVGIWFILSCKLIFAFDL